MKAKIIRYKSKYTKPKYIVKAVIASTIGYFILFLMSSLLFRFFFKQKINVVVYQTSAALHILPSFLISFTLFSATIIYLFNSWLGKKWVRLSLPKVFLYMGTLAGAGPTGEIIVNFIWRLVTHQQLWAYQLLPVHGGDTSIVMSVIWPLYGFHIYCFHSALRSLRDKTTDVDMAMLFGIDAITLEVVANVFSIFFFSTYIFYYFAGDLNHLSTVLAFIPYIFGGYLAIRVLHSFEKKHHQIIFGLIGFLWSGILIFLL